MTGQESSAGNDLFRTILRFFAGASMAPGHAGLSALFKTGYVPEDGSQQEEWVRGRL